MPPEQIVLIVFLVIVLIISLVIFWMFASLFQLWLQATMCGAKVSLLNLVGMKLRRSDCKHVVNMICMAKQCGLDIRNDYIESAIIQGADVQTALITLQRAKEREIELSWEDAISEDARRRIVDANQLAD